MTGYRSDDRTATDREMFYEPKFHDREEAGKILADQLQDYKNKKDVIVLGLPRGGVPVAYEVATSLNVPLDVFIVRKLGVPGQEEFAFGALASGGVRIVNNRIIRALSLSEQIIDAITKRESAELERREKLYRGSRPAHDLHGKTVIVVDDGLATGATMHAAVKALQSYDPEKIIVAVPVASTQACDEFKTEADVWAVCAVTPEPFYGVGMWYQDFSQTTDTEVQELLASAWANEAKSSAAGKGGVQ